MVTTLVPPVRDQEHQGHHADQQGRQDEEGLGQRLDFMPGVGGDRSGQGNAQDGASLTGRAPQAGNGADVVGRQFDRGVVGGRGRHPRAQPG